MEKEKFKQEMKDNFIPSVKEMIIKEEAHLKKMNSYLDPAYPIKTRKYAQECIEISEKALAHYKMRLQEYEDFVK